MYRVFVISRFFVYIIGYKEYPSFSEITERKTNNMKRILSLVAFVAIMLLSFPVFAQSDYQDVVYLKNGSVIHGIIIEQIPNVSIKIQTADRNIFVYNISEVEKITKELLEDDSYYGMRKKRNTSKQKNTNVYRGFFDIGYAVGVGTYKTNRLVINTSHGYQINPLVYIGGGFGLHYFSDWEELQVPIFVNSRLNFIDNNITPFLDVKVGYSVAKNEGFYFSPSAGVKFDLDAIALNLSVGYEMQYIEIWGEHFNFGAVSFRFGIEF